MGQHLGRENRGRLLSEEVLMPRAGPANLPFLFFYVMLELD